MYFNVFSNDDWINSKEYLYNKEWLNDFRPKKQKDYKLFYYKYKLTPHYFDLKCRCNYDFTPMLSSKSLSVVDKRISYLPFYIECKLIYRKRNYYPFKSWFHYWKLGFIRKFNKERSKYSVARTRQTLFDLCSCNFVKGHSLFLTLTYDVNHKLQSTIYDTKGAFNYDKALIDIKRFCQRFKRLFGESMKYCYFIEKQNGKHNNYNYFTGAFHFHILIFNAVYFKMGLKFKDCKENAQKLWGHGIAFVEKVPQRNINNTCKYISKYVSKDTLCVESGNHALHSSKGLKRPKTRLFFDVPSYIDNCISLELNSNLGLLPRGLNISDLSPFLYDGKNYVGNLLSNLKYNKMVIKSRYIEILIMRLPRFDKNDKPFIDINCDFLVKIHCDLDYRKNFFKKNVG